MFRSGEWTWEPQPHGLPSDTVQRRAQDSILTTVIHDASCYLLHHPLEWPTLSSQNRWKVRGQTFTLLPGMAHFVLRAMMPHGDTGDTDIIYECLFSGAVGSQTTAGRI